MSKGQSRRRGDGPVRPLGVQDRGAAVPQERGWTRVKMATCRYCNGGPAGAGIPHPKRQLFVDAFELPPRKRPGRPKTKKPIRKPRRKPTVRKPAKKAKPKPRPEPTQAEVEAKRQKQLEFDRQRSKTPERREKNRLQVQERRRSAKELGLCRDCPNPAIPEQSRCPTCAEKHRVDRRRWQAERRAKNG